MGHECPACGWVTRAVRRGLMAHQIRRPTRTCQDAQLLIRESWSNPTANKWWALGPSLQHPPHEGGRCHANDKDRSRKSVSSKLVEGKPCYGRGCGVGHCQGCFICYCCWLILGFSKEEMEWKENRGVTAHIWPSDQGHLSDTHLGFPRFLGLLGGTGFFHSLLVNPWISLDT